MADHDQRLKSILQAFFVEFLALFFPKWAERLDASAAVWLDKEAFNDPPEGRRRVLDLLARVPVRPGTSPLPGNPTELIALVHTEIEAADRTTVAREQLWLGYAHLRSKYRLPVLPLAVYLNVGLESRSTVGAGSRPNCCASSAPTRPRPKISRSSLSCSRPIEIGRAHV